LKHHTAKTALLTITLVMLVVAACAPSSSDDVVPAPPTSAPVTEGVRVYVDAIDILIMESFPVQVAAIVRGNLPNGCSRLDGVSVTRTNDVFTLTFETRSEGDVCTEALVPFEERVSLDVLGLEAGSYRVVAGDVETTFTLDMDNSPADASGETVQDLRGTVTSVEIGTDGIQVGLDSDGVSYSITISALQATVAGRWEDIVEGAEIQVSGPVDSGTEPTLVVAETVTVLGSDPDHALAPQDEISGEIAVRAPSESDVVTVALPEGATLTVRLQDISRQDVAAELLSEAVYDGVTQLPIAYELPYDPDAIDDRMTYAVSAVIQDADGRMIYRSDTVHSVLTRGSGTTADIELIPLP